MEECCQVDSMGQDHDQNVEETSGVWVTAKEYHRIKREFVGSLRNLQSYLQRGRIKHKIEKDGKKYCIYLTNSDDIAKIKHLRELSNKKNKISGNRKTRYVVPIFVLDFVMLNHRDALIASDNQTVINRCSEHTTIMKTDIEIDRNTYRKLRKKAKDQRVSVSELLTHVFYKNIMGNLYTKKEV